MIDATFSKYLYTLDNRLYIDQDDDTIEIKTDSGICLTLDLKDFEQFYLMVSKMHEHLKTNSIIDPYNVH